jgi:hypothetical protein
MLKDHKIWIMENEKKINERNDRPDDQYKNIETAVNNPASFDDDYEVGQEDEISYGERKSEQANQGDKAKE